MRKSVLSRRNAASLIAGLLVVPASGFAEGARAPIDRAPSDIGFDVALSRSRKLLFELFAKMRNAPGAAGLNKEFVRFKRAYTSHDFLEVIAAATSGRSDGLRENELYRREDTARTLARVIVRELDAWPKKDAGWARRLDELERVVRERAAAAA